MPIGNRLRIWQYADMGKKDDDMSSYHKKMMAMLDGVEGMDDTSASLVRWAQNAFGDAGGDVARAVVQAPATFARGIGGGAVSANAGINQMLRDYTPLGALPVVSDWLQDAANQGSKDAARIQSGATANYQTAIGRDVGQGINSLGATAPLTAAAVATKNPAIMYGGMGAQTGFTEYGNARQAGLSPLNALSYAGNQTAIETATEKLPAGALVDAFKTSSPVASLIKSPLKYALGEAGGEQLATLGQDFIKGAYIDSQTNDNWLQDYQDSRLDAARSTLVSSLVAGGGNVAIGSVSNAAAEAVGGNKSNRYKRLMAELDKPQSGNANQANQFLKDSVVGGGMKTRNDIPTVRQATQQNIKYREVSGRDAIASTVNKIIGVESGGKANAKNPNSSATGLGQFIGSTWLNMVKRHRPDIAAGKSDSQILSLRTNPELSREMTTRYTQENAAGLRKNGLPITEGNLYLSHFAGIDGARKLLNAQDKSQNVANILGNKVVNANGFLKGKSVQWTIDWAHKKMGGKSSATSSQVGFNSGYSIGGNDSFGDDMPIQGANMYDDNLSNIMRNAASEQEDAARAMAAAAEEQAYQARRAGRATRVFLDGKMQDATLELMDADDLTPSVANTDNQYRDRSRAASQMQINQIANNLEPELLGDSKQIDSGAPTLAADGKTIIGGNGRVMAINQAYEQGNGENYRQYLIDNAEQFGLNPDDIQAMGKPILVRRFSDASIDTNKAAVASNEGGGLGMSSLEQARVDAERLPDFGTFVPSENGELNTPANRGFIRDFVGSMPTTIQAQMIGADGQLSQDGVRRLRNAMLYSAYGNSPALSRMVESTDVGMKNMVNAMMQVAPTIAKAKNHIKDGAMHRADISDDIVSAVEKINQIHESGGSVDDYLAQQGMFEDDLSPVARDLVAFFDEHKRSAKAISTLLKNYYDLLAAQGNPAEADMFGDVQTPSKKQLLDESVSTYERQNGKQQQSDIFEREQRTAGEPDSETGQQPAGGRSDETGVGENTGAIVEQQRVGDDNSDGLKYSRSESTRANYERRIDELFNGAKADKFGGVTVLDRADILDMLGYGDMPLRLVEGKVIAGQTNHPLMTADVWKKIPDWVDSPAMVFDSDTVDGRLVFIAPEKVRGNDVRIVIEPKGDELQAHMLVNAYDKDTSSPYLRWANDRLLRYVDKTKAARINERFGLRLPDILKNPSLAPNAQIHSMGRGNTKDLRLGKILTENNLQGYRKNRDSDKQFERSQTEKVAVSDEYISELQAAVKSAIGNKNARFVDVVRLDDVSRPENAYDLINAQGWYSHDSRRITLIADNLPNAETAQFVAWHELGHKKIHADGWDNWQSLIKQADSNANVKRLADAIYKERKGSNDAAANNRMAAVEEALVELYAAKQADNLAALESKYGVSLPNTFKDGLGGYLARVASRIKGIIQDVLGIQRDVFSDGEVFGLLKRIDSADVGNQTETDSDGLNETGDESSTDNSNDDARFSRGDADMSKKERVLFNELGELQIGLAAYNKLGEVIKPLASKAGLANGYHENFTQYMRDHMASINAAGRTAKQIAEMGKKLTESERKLLSDVLEKELPEGAEVTPEIQELADTIRTIFNQQTDDLVALEMVSKESAERFRDTYLPRMYNKIDMLPESIDKMHKQFNRALRGGLGKAIAGKHLKGRGIFKEVNRGEVEKYEAQGFEIREDYGTKGQKANKVLMWRDYTKEERTAMGEERDAMLRFSVGYIQTQSDIAKGMLFKRIASDENLASITPVDGWVKVPDTEIAGTGGVKRYGALAGMYVHPDIQVALANQFYVDSTIQKVWRSMLGWWKITKTVYNPVAHVNNVISNIVMTTTAGASPKDISAGAVAVKYKNALYQEALEHGLVGEAVDVAGIREMFTGLNNVSDGQLTDLLITRAIKRADKLTGQVVSRAGKFAQDAYRAEDEVFRMALYKMARDRGLNPKEAADYAYTFMFDYADVPPTIRKVRDLGILPFISYTYKAVPAMARLALTRPHRMLVITSLMYGINALSYLLLGGEADEEEERENMPEYQKGYTSLGTPKLIRLPFNDSDGKPMFIDVYRWLPLGDFADTQNQMGGIPLPQWLTPNGPVINHTLALLANKDTFTGKEVVKDYQSTEEKAKTYGKWLASQWLPASVGVPYSYHTNNVLDGLKNQFEGTKFADVLEYMGYTGTDSRGDGKQLYRAALGSVGVKIRGEDPAELKARKARYIQYQIREVQADMRRISRDNRLTDDSKRSKIESRREHIKELQRKLSGQSDNESETD